MLRTTNKYIHIHKYMYIPMHIPIYSAGFLTIKQKRQVKYTNYELNTIEK